MAENSKNSKLSKTTKITQDKENTIITGGTAPFNVVYSDVFNNVPVNGISSPYNFQTNTAGNYTLSSITDINGCYGNVYGVAIVVVNSLPDVDFLPTPQRADINNPIISFTDLSYVHVAGIYDFGDGITQPKIPGEKLSHTYLDT